MKNKLFLSLLFSLLIGFPCYAHAYIEPGIGSLLIQALFGGFIGAAVILRSYWHKIVTFFASKKDK